MVDGVKGTWRVDPAQLSRLIHDRKRTVELFEFHEDVPFTKTMTAAVDREIKNLARWLQLDGSAPR